jgi:PAS domain-containing protein
MTNLCAQHKGEFLMPSPLTRLSPAPEALRAAAFDLGPNPSLVFTADGALRMANEAAERFFGQSLGS